MAEKIPARLVVLLTEVQLVSLPLALTSVKKY
jgi:hypothetical protein